jgi:long-subunit acyl-CoA synthetase (AMP-forming)
LGIEGKTKEEVSKNPKFIKAVNKGIDEANKMAISKAQYIRKWVIIDDFSVGDELTPTLKLKRKVVEKKYVE